jgi:hypothetical protein
VLRQRGERRAARIDAYGDALVPGVAQEVDHLEQQRGGQIVDAVVAGVFQDLERDALAGTRQAADED